MPSFFLNVMIAGIDIIYIIKLNIFYAFLIHEVLNYINE